MTGKPLADVWASRDYPVLVEVARRVDAGERSVRIEDVEETLGMSFEEVTRAALALERRGLLTTDGTDQWPVAFIENLSGDAYPLTGLHPSPESIADGLLATLDDAIEKASDGDKKTRLKRAREALGAMGRDLLV